MDPLASLAEVKVDFLSGFRHGWSFFGKVGEAKMILADGFCANSAKISLFHVGKS